MRKLLLLEGLTRPEKRKGVPVMVERPVAERIARDAADALTLTGLEAHLGLGRKVVFQLVRSGVIPSWVIGGAKGQHGYLFRRAEITKWLESLMGAAPMIKIAPPDTISLADAPHDCRIPAVPFFGAIVRREIPVRGVLSADLNLRSAIVDIKDVVGYRAALRAIKPTNSSGPAP